VAEDQESLLVLDQGHDYTKGNHAPPSIFRYSRFPGKFPRELVFRLASTVNDCHPIDMILDSGANPKRLVVLDHPKNKIPRLLFITPVERGTAVGRPDTIELKDSKTDTKIVVTPMAIVQESANTFVIADARADGSANMGRGVFVRVTIEGSTLRKVTYESWDPNEAENNPLVYPTCLIKESEGVFLVCDTGFKVLSGKGSRDFRTMAEPAGLYRVKFAQGEKTPRITRLASRGGLMNPTKLASDRANGVILVADTGETHDRPVDGQVPWRGIPHRFGVSVLFSMERLPKALFRDANAAPIEQPDGDLNLALEQLASASRGIDLVIGQYKPLHAVQVRKIQT